MSAENETPTADERDWQCYRIRGLRADVKQKVAAEKLPDFVKSFIQVEIDGLPEDCIGAEVNAYGVSHAAPHALTRSIQVTLVGIKL